MKLLDQVLDNFLRPWRRYADFSGRASRSEFWTFAIGCLLVNGMLAWLAVALPFPPLSGDSWPLNLAFQLSVLMPGAAVAARRLHDINRSGWLQLLWLVPLIGGLVLLLYLAAPATQGANRYGSNSHGDPVTIVPQDGETPYANRVGRYIVCPHCGQRNPRGRENCQWCRKTYREWERPV